MEKLSDKTKRISTEPHESLAVWQRLRMQRYAELCHVQTKGAEGNVAVEQP